MLAYLALDAWFGYTVWRMSIGFEGEGDGFVRFIMGLIAAFLCAYMTKALFAVKNAKPEGLTEVLPEQQPALFSFLHSLADATGAPRPHKVYLSAQVNAAVFYDLSLLNLIFTSKKNLEIGLPLVNAMNLGELRAVLAHEFGHFAQRSMAVGRWVYVAQQIAAYLVWRRDALDEFLDKLGRVDIRITVFVLLVKLIVWSLRCLVESAFTLVVLVQRALSREMEMQADLVAVSLTGSDALVHALHKLQAADDAWDRSLQFAFGEQQDGQVAADLFAIQSAITAHVADIYDDPEHGQAPALPAPDQRAAHRIFKAGLAQAPRMWQTHPHNHEREDNAKRVYVERPIDAASAWSLFAAPQALREAMSAQVLGHAGETPAATQAPDGSPEEREQALLARLRRQFTKEHYKPCYGGIYLGRALTRHVASPASLRAMSMDPDAPAITLTPDSLKQQMQTLRALEAEQGQLRALIAGRLSAPNGSVRLRERDWRKKDWPQALAAVSAEADAARAALHEYDHARRSRHHALAARMQGDWAPYIDGLLAVLHFAEHSEANLADARGLLDNTVAVVTAVTVKEAGLNRILADANALHYLMDAIHHPREPLQIDSLLAARLEMKQDFSSWLGEYKLPPAEQHNINDWLRAVDSWLRPLVGRLQQLRSAALEQLLVTEALIATHARVGVAPRQAPTPSAVPPGYPTLLSGQERERQQRLGWWARFQRADGVLPGLARLAVAGGIVAAVLGVGARSGSTVGITVYNGLSTTVHVAVAGAVADVPARGHATLAVPPQRHYSLLAQDARGKVIESFEAERPADGAMVYNIAGAAVLQSWTVGYGNQAGSEPVSRGALRWSASSADHLFVEAPTSIQTKGGGGSRTVLFGSESANAALNLVQDPDERRRLVRLHLQWDQLNDAATENWLYAALSLGIGSDEVLARLKTEPLAVPLLRIEQDSATAQQRPLVCQRHQALAAATPGSADLAYLALRCQGDGPGDEARWEALHQRWPDNGWISYALVYAQLRADHWQAAMPLLEQVRRSLPARADAASVDLARLRRHFGQGQRVAELRASSQRLSNVLALELAIDAKDVRERPYAELAAGRHEQAVQHAKGVSGLAPHVLRLAAASDGATPALQKSALALNTAEGQDVASAWAMLGLALRSGQPAAPFETAAKDLAGLDAAPMRAFLQAAQAGQLVKADQIAAGLAPEARGMAYSSALVLLGRKAPRAWRAQVRKLLFVTERPYFS